MRALRSRIVSSDCSETEKDQNSSKIIKRGKKSKRKTVVTTEPDSNITNSSRIKRESPTKSEEEIVVFVNETLKYSMKKQGTRDTLLSPIFLNAVTSTAIKPPRFNSGSTTEDDTKSVPNKRKKLRKQKNNKTKANSVASAESDSTINDTLQSIDKFECINFPKSDDNLLINNISDSVLIVDDDVLNTSTKSASLSGNIVNHTFTKEVSEAHFFGKSGEWKVESLWAQAKLQESSKEQKNGLKETRTATQNKENTVNQSQSSSNGKFANKSSKFDMQTTKNILTPSNKFVKQSPIIAEYKISKTPNKNILTPSNIFANKSPNTAENKINKTQNKEKNLIKTPARKLPKISPKTKSVRKKWENGNNSLLLLEQIGSAKKADSLSIRKSLYKAKSPLNNLQETSTQKIKRTALPNFALIHQRANEKLESVLEYSNRKKERAKKLLSGGKQNVITSQASGSGKSSKKLFEPIANSKEKFNRFGFKLREPPAKINLPNKPITIKGSNIKPILTSGKQAVSKRNEIREIANKNRVQYVSSRDNTRGILKGVRTNKRFELLMKMRQH